MSLINVSALSFAHPGAHENLFEKVSLQLDSDWKLGFIGRNGRGKTTFLKLLLGQYEYEGRISSAVNFSYFPFEVENPERPAGEVLAGIAPLAESWRVLRELSLLDLPESLLSQSFSRLSGGEKSKLLLAALFLRDNNFLLIDEPTNHLDLKGREVLARYLKGKRSFILVSHDRRLLDDCVDHILALNKKTIEIQKGNFSSWHKNYQERLDFELAENERLKKESRRLAEASRQSRNFSEAAEKKKIGAGDKGFMGHKAAKIMKRSKNAEKRRDKLLEEKSALPQNLENQSDLAIHPLRPQAAVVFEAHGLSLKYGPKTVCRNLDFTLRAGESLVVSGRNGCGKSTLLKLLAGQDIAREGFFRKAPNFKISYVEQSTDHLKGSIFDYCRDFGVDPALTLAILHKMGFNKNQFDYDLKDYSQGQKKKVLLARSLSQEAHLYIWDEPLNYIDLISRLKLEELILEYSPALVLVEHDRAFLDNLRLGNLLEL